MYWCLPQASYLSRWFSFDSPLLQLLKVNPEEVLIESTGVIGHRIKKVLVILLRLCFSHLLS